MSFDAWFNQNPVLGVAIGFAYTLLGLGTATFLMTLFEDPKSITGPSTGEIIALMIAAMVWPVVAFLAISIAICMGADKLARRIR